MNRTKISTPKKSPLGIFIIAITSIVFLQMISLFYNSDIGNKIEQKGLQKKLNDICFNMDDLAKEYKNAPTDFNFFSDSYLETTRNNNLTSFIYSQDTLVAWSDNDYIITKKIDTAFSSIVTTDNSIVFVKDYKLQNYNLRLCYSLASNYKIENEYLKNRLNPTLGLKKTAHINRIEGPGMPLFDAHGIMVAKVEWNDNESPNEKIMSIIFLLYIGAIISIILLIFSLCQFFFKSLFQQRIFKILSLSTILTIIKLAPWPRILLDSNIYDPIIFANSSIIDSLGSLFIISLFVFFALAVLLEYFDNPHKSILKTKSVYIFSYGGFLIILFLLFITFKFIVSALVFNSTISFNLAQPTEINHLTIIGLSSMGIWIFIIFIFYSKIYNWFKAGKFYSGKIWKTELLVTLLAIVLTYVYNDNYYALAFFIFLIILQNIIYKIGNYPKVTLTVLYLLGISILISFWLYSLNTIDEHNKRKSILQSVAIDQDPQAEYLFGKISQDIYSDKLLLGKIETNSIDFDSISNYIINNYFRKYQHFNKYDLQITTCTSDLLLLIQPQDVEVQCDSFFFNNLIKFGTLTDNKNLYFLQYGTGQTNYLGLFRFYENTPDGYMPYTVYVEINSKLKRKGYTKLLSEKAYDPFEKIAKYSLATYIDGKRVETYGNYSYPEHFSWNSIQETNFEFIEKNNFDHLVFRQDKNRTFVLSLKEPSFLNKLSPFSYLFVFFGLLFLILGFVSNNSLIKINLKQNFSSRLQLTMISIIIISFTIISTITVIYIHKLNEDKNRLQLENLAKSLQTEFEHKITNEQDISRLDLNYLQELLQKFSKVFDTDINIYNNDGRLIATTRAEIFEYPLLADLINPSAYNYLKIEKQGLFITKENIGGLLYSSAYLPAHNSIGKNIGYINLPYFAREEFLKKEISNLLMTLMNVYTLIIVLSILLILIVSNYITRPLSMLKQKLQEISLGKAIQKIEWHGIEEIKTLVDEYNQMIDALAVSSEKLAKGERESAWREMAKQVAHEIKNPLTPMKLSIQYLLHSYNENDENNRDRIQSLSNTLIEQIDTLSDIATAFSDFAKMPKSIKELQDLRTVIKSVIDLFADYKEVIIDFKCEEEQLVNIDKSQWIRVFNNLIKNSIQATVEGSKTEIKIELTRVDNTLKITFSDNGKGIPEEMKDKIFTPNFTTKTKGTGLGLAMVKNIVNNNGGEIHFASTPNIGTDFYITIPLNNESISYEQDS